MFVTRYKLVALMLAPMFFAGGDLSAAKGGLCHVDPTQQKKHAGMIDVPTQEKAKETTKTVTRPTSPQRLTRGTTATRQKSSSVASPASSDIIPENIESPRSKKAEEKRKKKRHASVTSDGYGKQSRKNPLTSSRDIDDEDGWDEEY